MVKTITIQIPDWMDEEKLREAIIQAVSLVTKELSIEEVRKMLGIQPEDLTEELEVENVEKIRERELAEGRKMDLRVVIEDFWAFSKGRLKGGKWIPPNGRINA